MFSALITILKDNWEWRKQIGRLAFFELIKKSRGAVLSWAWLFVKPAMYIFVFWFALDLGLRAGGSGEYDPYFLWLIAGLIPWFYMQDMIGPGADVLHRYSYLVNKIKFPLSGISTIFSLSTLIVQLGLMVVLFVIYFLLGMPLDIYLLQVPVLILLMFVFFNMFSIFASHLSAMSKDFLNLLKAFSTPIFWMSGVIFDVSAIPIQWVQNVLLFNPVTFFVTSFRNAFHDKAWFWENTQMTLSFGIVFVVTLFATLWVYKRLSREVSDAL